MSASDSPNLFATQESLGSWEPTRSMSPDMPPAPLRRDPRGTLLFPIREGAVAPMAPAGVTLISFPAVFIY